MKAKVQTPANFPDCGLTYVCKYVRLTSLLFFNTPVF